MAVILKDAITTLASEGYMSIQIPEYAIGTGKVETEIIPDDWIATRTFLGSKLSPSIGKQGGFTHLTRKGWEANKDKIKIAFLNSKNPRGTWKEFVSEVEQEFAEIEESKNKRIAKLKKDLKELENCTI